MTEISTLEEIFPKSVVLMVEDYFDVFVEKADRCKPYYEKVLEGLS